MNIEDQEQAKVFRWADLQTNVMPELALLHAIPNGGQRSKATAAILKATGVKAGVPDICLPVARQSYHGLYIELKRPATAGRRQGKVSEIQSVWLERLHAQGYCVDVCYGAEEAIRTIRSYLGRAQ